MAAVAYLAAHPELPRPAVRIAFTPDEEIGDGRRSCSTSRRFGVRRAYTVDGSALGELQDESFSAVDRDRDVHRRRHPPRDRDREAGQRAAARRLGSSPSFRRDRLTPGNDERARGLHPPVRADRHSASTAVVRADRSRLRRRSARRAPRAAGADRATRRPRRFPAPRCRSRRERQYSQHARVHRARPARDRRRRGGDAAGGDRADPRRDPRRHRRLASSASAVCRPRTSSTAATSSTRCASGRPFRISPHPPRRSSVSPAVWAGRVG